MSWAHGLGRDQKCCEQYYKMDQMSHLHIHMLWIHMVSKWSLMINQIPFQEHHVLNYHLFLLGQKHEPLNHVSFGIKKLLHCCWHHDPHQQVDWNEIIHIIKLEW